MKKPTRWKNETRTPILVGFEQLVDAAQKAIFEKKDWAYLLLLTKDI